MKSIATLISFLTFCTLLTAQPPKYQLTAVGTNPVSQSTIVTAKTVLNVNPEFPSSWIKKYKSLSVTTVSEDGTTMSASGQGAMLNGAQKSLLERAAIGDDFQFRAIYTPTGEEVLADREIDFTVTVCPAVFARYAEGDEALEAYLAKSLEQLGTSSTALGTATVLFTVTADGDIADIVLENASANMQLNQLLLKTIQQMPAWTPAKTAEDTVVAQRFRLSAGDMVGC